MDKQLFIVIPIYNESTVILSVIKEVQDAGYTNIIIIDDGSKDNPGNILSVQKVIFLQHSLNRGKGAAIKTGFEASKLLQADVLITIDGDGQHNPDDIKRLLKKIDQGYDVVLGTRLKDSTGMPKVKVLANHIGNFFTWLIYGLWVSDSQSGFRAYSKKALEVIDTKTDRYEFDSEIIREIAQNKLKYIEIPIEVRYTDYSMNKLQKQSFSNGIKTLIKMFIT